MQGGGWRVRFCADVTKKCSVDTEEEITEENCEEEIIIRKTGAECPSGPHTGGKNVKPNMTNVSGITPFRAARGTGPRL